MAEYRPPDNTYVPPPVPVMAQPGSVYPSINTAVPNTALSYIEQLDQLIIKQEIHLADVVLDFKTNVKFHVSNSQGQPFLSAEEDNDCCNRNCCGKNRSFEINIKDLNGFTQIRLERPLRCCGCCFPCCCLQEMTVESPPGNVIGYVKENWNICVPSFTICDAGHNELFHVTGTCCPEAKLCHCGQDIHFEVTDAHTSQPVGRVSKHWAGLMQEAFTDASNFGVSFPQTMPINQKSLMLSLAFLANFMYFEHDRRTETGSSSNNQ